MKLLTYTALALALALGTTAVAEAGYGYYYPSYGYYRPYYSSYSYYNYGGYYYSKYYYQPSHYHYVIATPRYSYYYNPYRKVYWGRYDHEAKGYSLLKEEHRKGTLAEIKPEWFPAPGEMPRVPEAGDDAPRMEPPPAPPALPTK